MRICGIFPPRCSVFTVYGPWGRPDMALFKFVEGILNGRPIDIYNHGKMYRDFTYVEDLVRGIRLLIDAVPARPADRVVPQGIASLRSRLSASSISETRTRSGFWISSKRSRTASAERPCAITWRCRRGCSSNLGGCISASNAHRLSTEDGFPRRRCTICELVQGVLR